MWEYRAAVLRIIDADTIVVLADCGFGGRQEEHIRLLAVSAPELRQPGGPESLAFVVSWAAMLARVQWPLLIRTQPNSNPEPTERRTLVRYLGTVTELGPPYRNLNADVAAWLAGHPEWGTGN